MNAEDGKSLKPKLPDKAVFEELYERYNRREFVSPDPLQFLYDYEEPRDREAVGMIASSLAYGRVAQILASVESVLDALGPAPGRLIESAPEGDLEMRCKGFKHRWTTGEDMARLLVGIKRVNRRFGSLEACFMQGFDPGDETILPALDRFVAQLEARGPCSLLAAPCRGSACKRLLLFLRWMVRSDAVDPGGWNRVPASKLIAPIDTHMHRIGVALGLTRRRQADLKAAREITRAFAAIAPHDPVRYDFALTRLGIRPDADLGRFLIRCGVAA